MPDDRALGERLVAAGRMSADALARCVAEQAALGLPLISVLRKHGFLRVDELSRAQELLETAIAPAGKVASAKGESADSREAAGERIGRYVVQGELGRGGMGVVYRALDTELRRPVALKMVLDPSRAGAAEIARFRREAAACAQLRHPGIVSVFEVGEHEKRPYLVMELVVGESFESLLSKAAMPPKKVAEIVRGVALALEHAHERGVIHRDVKPQNVIVDRAGAPHLMDFGLARSLAATAQLTATGDVLGTPAYMAPEQAEGTPGDHGPWTDVYALGAVLFRGLTGRPPFEAASVQALLWQVISKEPVSPRKINAQVHPDLETIALRCLAKEKERRLPSARFVADELGRYLEGVPILSRPMGGVERARVWVGRNRKLALAFATAGLAVVLAAVAVPLWLSSDQEARRLRKIEEDQRAAQTLVSDARAHYVARDFAAAVRDCSLALERDPSSKAALLSRASTYYAMEELDLAISDASRVIEIDGDCAEALALRASSLRRKGDHAGAVTDWKRVVDLDPRSARSLWNLASARYAVRDYDRAIEEASRSIALQPSAEPFAIRALARAQKGDLDGAVADCDRAVELGPSQAGAWYFCGDVRLVAKDYARAIDAYTKAVALDPKLVEAWNNRGAARQKVGDVDGALYDLSRAVELDPHAAHRFCGRAIAWDAKKDYAHAIEDYTRAIELDPKSALAWDNRGLDRLEQGDKDRALADISRAIELEPARSLYWSHRGLVKDKKRDLRGAIADYTRAIELDAKNKDAWEQRGVDRRLLRDFRGAVDDAAHAVELAPNDAAAWILLGIARQAADDPDGAIAAYDRVVELNPRFALAFNNRGDARMTKGDIEGAIADATRAIAIQPDLPEAWGTRAEARDKKGDVEGAIADFEKFLEVAPGHPEAKKARARLEELRRSR
ncbi:tetratricopeptide repeat protein [bacterium]|nr:tetratricopeptide repeat protein [bacterium]